jgi:hypothetical protein
MLLYVLFHILEPTLVGTIHHGDSFSVRQGANFTQDLEILSAETERVLKIYSTFRFSTCRSPGDPAKLNRYGGYSESLACAYAIFLIFGILQSEFVNISVVRDSCHIRRLICSDEDDKSRLTTKVSFGNKLHTNPNYRGENISIPKLVIQ